MDSRSKPDGSPCAATDQAKALFRKMSASTMSPVTVSTRNDVAPSVRSSSGRLWKPMVVTPSPPRGVAAVKPTNCAEVTAVGTASQVANALATVSCSCSEVTPGTPRSVTK